ncbi:hypothetical protein HYV12_03800 [Candidatus Dojkabacteria bacterium]|nr:hypothetical protein [Candidatus Dojkabacteria bacterium]
MKTFDASQALCEKDLLLVLALNRDDECLPFPESRIYQTAVICSAASGKRDFVDEGSMVHYFVGHDQAPHYVVYDLMNRLSGRNEEINTILGGDGEMVAPSEFWF